MNNLAELLSVAYPNRQWALPENGGIVDIQWLDGEAPEGIETALAQADSLLLATQIRAERDAKLAACDWTQAADAPVNQAIWATYRQALRDITDQETFPESVIWPEEP